MKSKKGCGTDASAPILIEFPPSPPPPPPCSKLYKELPMVRTERKFDPRKESTGFESEKPWTLC